MHLHPREQEKLMIVVAADLARRRQARGLKLNYPETVAILTYELMEGARDGKSVAELMAYGPTILSTDDVLPGVAEMIHDVQVEATFPDGTKLVTIHQPIRPNVDSAGAADAHDDADDAASHPGEVITDPNGADITCNEGRDAIELEVTNTGDRPIQVGSHYHFAEANAALVFDREAARGRRLDIAAGTAVRLEPGDTTAVSLIDMGGNRIIRGFHNDINGPLDADSAAADASLEGGN